MCDVFLTCKLINDYRREISRQFTVAVAISFPADRYRYR